MTKLTVLKNTIISRSGSNGLPGNGTATFNDGRTYGWSRHRLTGEVFFVADRIVSGEWQSVPFNAPRRAAALDAFLNS